MSDEKALVEKEESLEVIPEQSTTEAHDVTPYQGIAQYPVTKDQEKLLTEPVPPDELDILPTGEIYASQIFYRRKLNKVFGPRG